MCCISRNTNLIYKLVATGFPVCPTCSHEVSILDQKGLEHAVAAPRTVANSSIMAQFFRTFKRPAETTISASAIATFQTFLLILLLLQNHFLNWRIKIFFGQCWCISDKPYEFCKKTLTSVEISVMLNALFESISSYWKEVLTGNPTTFEAKPASRATATNEEGKYCL
jgi:hypothetical protein